MLRVLRSSGHVLPQEQCGLSHWHLNDEEHGAVDGLRPPVEAVEAVAVLLRAEEAVPLVALEAGRQVAVEQLPLVVTHLEGVQFYKGGDCGFGFGC